MHFQDYSLEIRSSFHLKFLQQNLHHVTLARSLVAVDEDGGVAEMVRLQEHNSAAVTQAKKHVSLNKLNLQSNLKDNVITTVK